MTTRLNARIAPELARKVAYLRRRTQQNTTQVVKASIEAYYRQVSQEGSVAELLADFVNSGSGPRELSTNYKSELTRSLARKARS